MSLEVISPSASKLLSVCLASKSASIRTSRTVLMVCSSDIFVIRGLHKAPATYRIRPLSKWKVRLCRGAGRSAWSFRRWLRHCRRTVRNCWQGRSGISRCQMRGGASQGFWPMGRCRRSSAIVRGIFPGAGCRFCRICGISSLFHSGRLPPNKLDWSCLECLWFTNIPSFLIKFVFDIKENSYVTQYSSGLL